nr:MAG TPA: hypothetical protein [Caudoviricetes sp.]
MTDVTKIIRDTRLVACIMSYIEIVDKNVTSEIYVDISGISEDLINKLKENLNKGKYKYDIVSSPSLIEIGEIDRIMHIYFNKEEE